MNSIDTNYIKIRTILGVDTKTIHKELTTELESSTSSYRQSSGG